jgi:hypothetical protein
MNTELFSGILLSFNEVLLSFFIGPMIVELPMISGTATYAVLEIQFPLCTEVYIVTSLETPSRYQI